MASQQNEDAPDQEQDEDTQAILDRRRFLIESTLAGTLGMGVALSGCESEPDVCLSVEPEPGVCLSVIEEEPQPCLSVEIEEEPQPCLSVMPPDPKNPDP